MICKFDGINFVVFVPVKNEFINTTYIVLYEKINIINTTVISIFY